MSNCLSHVLETSNLVLITGVNENDPLQLKPSSVPVMLSIRYEEYHDKGKEVSRLMAALSSARINLQAVQGDVLCDDMCKFHNFPRLKGIAFGFNRTMLQAKHVKDLTESINSWGPEPQLRSLLCSYPINVHYNEALSLFIPFVKALTNCINIKDLGSLNGTPSACIPALMGAPPPKLMSLWLISARMNDTVLESITKATKKRKLQQLEELTLNSFGTSDAALTSLVKAFIEVRPDKKLQITADRFSVEVGVLCQSSNITLKQSLRGIEPKSSSDILFINYK